MRRFVEGMDRGLSTLFPECLQDWIAEDNPVRVIDVFVDELNLGDIGFTEHYLIVAHEVTNSGSDRAQLTNMATQAKAVLGVDKLEAVADRGYYSSDEVKACEDADIAVTLPKRATSSMEAKGRFGKHDFVYLADVDAYRCPAGEVLGYHSATVDDGRAIPRHLLRTQKLQPVRGQSCGNYCFEINFAAVTTGLPRCSRRPDIETL